MKGRKEGCTPLGMDGYNPEIIKIINFSESRAIGTSWWIKNPSQNNIKTRRMDWRYYNKENHAAFTVFAHPILVEISFADHLVCLITLFRLSIQYSMHLSLSLLLSASQFPKLLPLRSTSRPGILLCVYPPSLQCMLVRVLLPAYIQV